MPQRMQGYTEFRGTPWPPVTTTTPEPAAAGSPPEPVVADAPDMAAAPDIAAAPAAPGRRMAGYTPFRGTPWPPAVPATAEVTAADVAATAATGEASASPAAAPAEATRPRPTQAPSSSAPSSSAPSSSAPSAPEPSTSDRAREGRSLPARSFPALSGRRGIALGVGAAVVVALFAVLGARWLITVPAVADFVARYPGVPEHAASTPVGVPWWLAAQHFLNAFLLVLVIRTGVQIRHEARPPATFTPRKPGLFAPRGSTGRPFSLTIWIHQVLDVLWVLNGLVYVVLTLTTGHWRRLIPTDPDTPLHMVSTALQYATLDWPAHDGWLHYNALQMVSYAGVVFVLAPLAALTGYRMSSWWPAENAALSRAFPMALARRVHFPVMLLFIVFVVIHVGLVLFSGVLRNLNAMFLARQAADWWGLVAFLVAVAVTAAAWLLLKPAVISPLAERFGRVGR
ncbi:cytochrome b/b6 domain-containing protein [Micrococcus sp.]|uniref:cytochrome b/b6 domain-containing protein n=1 Tax=Micrococcus sp. TaxID=1271 RepID=UPI002A917DB8|nr:cytochrome b/b6 domain-containing protein [Micrococcus sp.]MDY6056102.1 cytochrome b/b6 domain-containing protein [Micrococcus sp.]